ncbi:YfbK domain-containing protein [Aquimarina sp. 2201CG14-23]|uniref:YfbK domain-containing protein n=1 Tax=Aquimarina mycalae TaxID=3040073 RepID=UPI002477FEEA|nr:von Willebrand factor type A domain-containing protein [Aquimarina sp. 2201CG14-23]MDH7446503.1 von Willebrand factor type A domain-containing protein [Aquimarina sp. 2201CG14-23]
MKTLHYLIIIFLYTGASFAQQIKITGTVIEDSTGTPLPGVNVVVKETTIGTQTDFDGKYTIQTEVGKILTFNYVGMQSQEVKIKPNTTELNIRMIEDVSTLEEVVVTAYGTQKRSYSVGSAVAISSESRRASRAERRRARKLRKKPNAQASQNLSGTVSGLTITSNTGATVKIRGNTSTSNSQQPLYIVDGVPINKKNVVQIQNIDPSKIANVEVLKDARAAAIYGSRATHGCIVITTHKGNYKIENNESYEEIVENSFEKVQTSPLSTFSIDVDKASYSNVRRMINNGQKVPADAVKIEEMVNYFEYSYEQPKGDHPFAIHTEYGDTPWNKETQLIKIGLKGKEIPQEAIPASNLVFLIDVSGSMSNANKLPLLKKAFKLLVNQLREKDKVSIVVYAGAAGMVLEPTSGAHKNKINQALDNLNAGGSTAGGAGIQLAYKIAQENFKKNGNNRVILATDGDFNVGMSSDKDMKTLIEEKRKSGVFLTCLGFGMHNYKDSKLETLADKGNGNHAYIDTMQEAQRVLGKEFGGTLYTIAKDVKIQVEFNPAKVQAYRLIGYENRLLADEDFVDDTKDAGELGSGHTVTALYEVIPNGVKSKYINDIPDLKYTDQKVNKTFGDELLTVKFRYKRPQESKSIEMVHILKADEKEISKDFNFAASVAWFGMKIRKSKYLDNQDLKDIIALAEENRSTDNQGYRAEFIRLMSSYEAL